MTTAVPHSDIVGIHTPQQSIFGNVLNVDIDGGHHVIATFGIHRRQVFQGQPNVFFMFMRIIICPPGSRRWNR